MLHISKDPIGHPTRCKILLRSIMVTLHNVTCIKGPSWLPYMM